VNVYGPSWFYFTPLKILYFDFNADPDPAFHSKANPDPASENKSGSGSATLATGLRTSLLYVLTCIAAQQPAAAKTITVTTPAVPIQCRVVNP
jgi:hypothetical protein